MVGHAQTSLLAGTPTQAGTIDSATGTATAVHHRPRKPLPPHLDKAGACVATGTRPAPHKRSNQAQSREPGMASSWCSLPPRACSSCHRHCPHMAEPVDQAAPQRGQAKARSPGRRQPWPSAHHLSWTPRGRAQTAAGSPARPSGRTVVAHLQSREAQSDSVERKMLA